MRVLECWIVSYNKLRHGLRHCNLLGPEKVFISCWSDFPCFLPISRLDFRCPVGPPREKTGEWECGLISETAAGNGGLPISTFIKVARIQDMQWHLKTGEGVENPLYSKDFSLWGRTVSPILTLVVAVLSLSFGKFNTVTSLSPVFVWERFPPLWGVNSSFS